MPREIDIEPALTSIRVGEATEWAFDYDGAIHLASRHSWDLFSEDMDQVSAFRQTLDSFIRRSQPSWLRLFPYGRDHVLEELTDNERQCFDIAGLVSGNTSEIVSWWDSLAAVARQDLDDRLLELGREGERKTLAYEQKSLSGTGLEPSWVAIDDNKAGFDVRSWREGDSGWGAPEPKFIETKSSSHMPRFILSRNEWDFAERHQHSWELQLWVAESEAPKHFSYNSLLAHIPQDTGNGRWREAEITIVDLDRK